jgi:uncharacterized membrane protein YjgN (DUF898 family)
MTWYYRIGDKVIGPVSKAELQQLVKDGKIGAQTWVRSVNAKEWRPLIELAKRPKPNVTPPPPPSQATTALQAVSPPPKGPGEPPPRVNGPSRVTPIAPLPVSAPAQYTPFQFNGNGGEYFKIWIVNVALTILTLGIYSAWAKVRRKQYFYGNTRVNGTSFQYLADPIKILKGRIIVFGLFLVYSVINQFQPLLGIVILLIFMPALPWFAVRALSFNARNSAIRNIRFNFHGTYKEAAKVFLLWPLLAPLTLGLISPYLFYRQKKYIIDNSAYGTARFRFKATVKDCYAIFYELLIPLVICVLVGLLAAGFGLPWLTALVFALFYPFAMAVFVVKSSNLLYTSSKLSAFGFNATMAIKQYLIIVVTNTLATILTLGFFYPFAQIRTYRYKISQLSLVSAGDLDQFVAAEKRQVSALGDEFTDFMDFDLGL